MGGGVFNHLVPHPHVRLEHTACLRVATCQPGQVAEGGLNFVIARSFLLPSDSWRDLVQNIYELIFIISKGVSDRGRNGSSKQGVEQQWLGAHFEKGKAT